MQYEHIVRVAKKYREMLPDALKIVDDTCLHPQSKEALQHCAWMCEEIFKPSMDSAKAMRWLCFVQGVIWMNGITTISEMKEDNRPDPEIGFGKAKVIWAGVSQGASGIPFNQPVKSYGCTGMVGPIGATGPTGPVGGDPYR